MAGVGDKTPNAHWQARVKGRFRKMTPGEKSAARRASIAAGEQEVRAIDEDVQPDLLPMGPPPGFEMVGDGAKGKGGCSASNAGPSARAGAPPPEKDQPPKHDYVFVVNPKVSIHCTFSHDSDEETGDWPLPMSKELKRKGENIRVLLKRKYFDK